MPRAQGIFLLISTLILIATLGFMAICNANEELYQEGVHYFKLSQPVPTSYPDLIEM